MRFMDRILGGIRQMLWAVVGSTVVAIAVYGTQGPPPGPHQPGLVLLVTAYFSMGIISGAILGLLKPYSRTRFGMFLTSSAVALPFMLGLTVLSHDGRILQLRTVDLVGAAILAVIVGPVVAAYLAIRRRDGSVQ